MNNYLLFLDKEKRVGYNRFSCRESFISAYRSTIKNYYNRKYANIPIYFGHAERDIEKVVERYVPFCNEIWRGKVKFELIELKDIDSIEAKYYYKCYGSNPILIKTIGVVNPLDISLILYYTWFGNFGGYINLKKYYLAKKYSDLIPNYLTNLRCGHGYYTGPYTYIGELSIYNYFLFSQINQIYSEHSSEVANV
jgi:hypothetical protein